MLLADTSRHTELPRTRLTGIEAGRGIASLIVVLFHATVIISLPKYFGTLPLGGIFSFGYAGVDFFFVLSGFIILFIHHSDIGKPETLRTYGIKRILRIYPLYWVISTLAVLALTQSSDSVQLNFDHILKSYFLLPQENIYPIVIGAWTLVHEVFFYLMFGILLFSFRLGLLLMGVWFIGILVTAGVGIKWGYLFGFVFNLHNIEFFLGMLIAFLCLSDRRMPYPILSVVCGVTLFCGTGMVDVYGNWRHSSAFLMSYAISSALIIYSLVSGELSGRFVVPKWSQFLGACSYSLYLTHFLVLSFIMKLALLRDVRVWMPLWMGWCVSVTFAIGAGLFFHYYVEQNLTRALRRRFLR